MSYKRTVICDVCGKEIDMPSARIEWNYSGNEMQICHHDCSHGMKNDTMSLSDMILDQGLYNEDLVKLRLNNLQTDHPEYSSQCNRILKKLF